MGGTPKKTIFRPLDSLVKTRDHETIRSEIKGPLMLAAIQVQVPLAYTPTSVPGMCVCVCVCMYVCLYICIYVCVYVYIYVCLVLTSI